MRFVEAKLLSPCSSNDPPNLLVPTSYDYGAMITILSFLAILSSNDRFPDDPSVPADPNEIPAGIEVAMAITVVGTDIRH